MEKDKAGNGTVPKLTPDQQLLELYSSAEVREVAAASLKLECAFEKLRKKVAEHNRRSRKICDVYGTPCRENKFPYVMAHIVNIPMPVRLNADRFAAIDLDGNLLKSLEALQAGRITEQEFLDEYRQAMMINRAC